MSNYESVAHRVFQGSIRRIQKLRPALITTHGVLLGEASLSIPPCVYMGFTDQPKGLALMLGDLY